MFSNSGYTFAKQKHKSLSVYLAPLDCLSHWTPYFSFYQPKYCIVIRHEIWPVFCYLASKRSRAILLNAGIQKEYKFFHRVLNKLLWSQFHRIYPVSKADEKKFLDLDLKNISSISGDTKYERVLQRKSNLKPSLEILKKVEDFIGTRSVLLIGSAWLPDVQVVLESYELLPQNLKDSFCILVVPHDLSSKNLKSLTGFCLENDLNFECYSDAEKMNPESRILFVDKMGFLAELYSLCQIAFVGGAMNHKVHNVLEPAIFGKTVVFGPQYKNSHEATTLIENRLAFSISSKMDLLSLWEKFCGDRHSMEKELSNHFENKVNFSSEVLKDLLTN